jgi:hypothetical protein
MLRFYVDGQFAGSLEAKLVIEAEEAELAAERALAFPRLEDEREVQLGALRGGTEAEAEMYFDGRIGRKFLRDEGRRLMEVVEFIDGTAARPGCFLAGSDACSDEDPCMAHESWAVVRDQYVAFLENTTLEDVSEHPHHHRLLKPTR